MKEISVFEKSILISNHSFVLAEEIDQTQILGINGSGIYEFVNIRKLKTNTEKISEIITPNNIMYCTIQAKIAGTGTKFREGSILSTDIKLGDRIANYNILLDLDIFLKNIIRDDGFSFCYLLGFRESCRLTKNNKFVSDNKIFFFDLTDENLIKFQTSSFIQFNSLIEWHKKFLNNVKIKTKTNKYFVDLTDLYFTGMIKHTILLSDIPLKIKTKGKIICSNNCQKFDYNLKNYLIGFLTGLLCYKKFDSYRTKRWYLNLEHIKIDLDSNPMLRMVMLLFAAFGFPMIFNGSKKQVTQASLSLENFNNIYSNTIVKKDELEKWADVTNKFERESTVIYFEADTSDNLWRPIIDFSIMKF